MNKKKLYNSIIESLSKELQNILLFDNSDIFNKEESLYDGSTIVDNYTYKNIIEKLKEAEFVSKKEYNYIHKNKYKVSSKLELRYIIANYSEKKPNGSLNWIDTSLIADMSNLFANTYYNGNINEWDVSNVTNMKKMFFKAKKFNQPIGDWNVRNVSDMSGMFYGALSFNLPIEDWDVSNVIDMSYMFYSASVFNQYIGNWNISNVRSISGIFSEAISFNQPIGNWDINNINDMRFILYDAQSFNQDISNWNISKVKYKYDMFYHCPIKEKYKPKN